VKWGFLCVLVPLVAGNASAQPVERSFAVTPELLFRLAAPTMCTAKTDVSRRTCEGQVLDPDKLLGDRLRTNVEVAAAGDGAVLRVLCRKPRAVDGLLRDFVSKVERNIAFGNFGRNEALNASQASEVIAWAKALKGIRFGLGEYRVDQRLGGQPFRTSTSYGQVLTPVARVAGLAIEAAARYQNLDAERIEPDVLAPLTWIAIDPFDYGEYAPAMNRYVDVETVVLLPAGSRDSGQAIQPVWVRPNIKTLSNALGATLEVRGVTAAFPTAEIQAGREVVILFRTESATDREKRIPIADEQLFQWMLLPELKAGR
jgi:hypothetical protein